MKHLEINIEKFVKRKLQTCSNYLHLKSSNMQINYIIKLIFFTAAQLVLLQTNWETNKLVQKKVVTKEKSPRQINSKNLPILCLVSFKSSKLTLKLWEPKCEHINCIQHDNFQINSSIIISQPQKAQFPFSFLVPKQI